MDRRNNYDNRIRHVHSESNDPFNFEGSDKVIQQLIDMDKKPSKEDQKKWDNLRAKMQNNYVRNFNVLI